MIAGRLELLFLAPTDEHPDGAWHAQTDCDCGSTFTGGEPWSTPTDAAFAAMSNLRAHLAAKVKPACGVAGHKSVQCRCDQCKSHDREMAKMLAPPVRS